MTEKKYILTALLALILLSGCSVQQNKIAKYPRMPLDDPERKSGPAMLLYEAAEEDADPYNVIVTPPPANEKGYPDQQ